MCSDRRHGVARVDNVLKLLDGVVGAFLAEVALKVDLGDVGAEITGERLAETFWDIRIEIKAVDGLYVCIIGDISCHIHRNLSIDSLHIAIEVTLGNRGIIRYKLGRHSK